MTSVRIFYRNRKKRSEKALKKIDFTSPPPQKKKKSCCVKMTKSFIKNPPHYVFYNFDKIKKKTIFFILNQKMSFTR